MLAIAQQLLNAALTLLFLVQGNPNVDYGTRQLAITVANDAIAYSNKVISSGGYTGPTEPIVPSVNYVKLPLIKISESTDYYGRRVCSDRIEYITRYITPTTQPLNATYRELFKERNIWFYDSNSGTNYYGTSYNVIPKLYNLSFVKATIENGTAHVYLRGSFEGLSEECDLSRPQLQLEAVAKQFPNIYRVEIHLEN